MALGVPRARDRRARRDRRPLERARDRHGSCASTSRTKRSTRELRPLPDVLRLVGRMGGNYWVRTRDLFELRRPTSVDPDEVRGALDGAG